MKTLNEKTAVLIQEELQSIPEKYQKNFNSTHEGYAVILEEVRELEHEVFFGAKMQATEGMHKQRMREECVQIAAMCARFIQELT